ncbi:MAG TPA: hypothetical protein VJU87_01175 [Gemmatimonadaceae bacterium]|nr:hypothetical protein [Gemmatimonadaceae bacterium]
MNTSPRQVVSLCPACDACPAVEIYENGTVRVGEKPNIVTLAAAEWNELVRAVKRGDLTEIPSI